MNSDQCGRGALACRDIFSPHPTRPEATEGDLLSERAGGDVPMRVLAIGAHPDDIELGCGAVLLAHRRRGDPVDLLVMTAGGRGPQDARSRVAEQEDAAALLGAGLRWGAFEDGRCRTGAKPWTSALRWAWASRTAELIPKPGGRPCASQVHCQSVRSQIPVEPRRSRPIRLRRDSPADARGLASSAPERVLGEHCRLRSLDDDTGRPGFPSSICRSRRR
ncbi:MAG: PIG-L deacetylase family protein [Acidimicrobiales bacterium]